MKLVVAHKPDERAKEIAERLKEILKGKGVAVEPFPGSDPCSADGVVVVGGDGTLLYVLSKMGCDTPPIMTVRAGRRAFLLDVEPEELEEAVDKFLNKEYEEEVHKRLKIESESGEAFALNEFAVLSTWRRVTKLNVKAGGITVFEGLEGDGVIVSTTVGSTAYALSAGGPLVDPRAEVLLLVPVNPIQLNARSVVLPSTLSIEVEIVYNVNEVVVLADGIRELKGERFEVSLTGPKVTFARFKPREFYRRLIELRSFHFEA